MSQLPEWLPGLIARINWGCSQSPLLARLAQNELAMETGKLICQELWPFIESLPVNISAVRDTLPDNAQAARSLLGQLADDERIYQQLFLKQCAFAGLSREDIVTYTPSQQTQRLCLELQRLTRDASYVNGIYAIVTAELAATAFCRAALPHYEEYFSKNSDMYPKEDVDEGLAWLRLHAKPQTRHALWLKRMLGDIANPSGAQSPEAVDIILQAVLSFLGCEDTTACNFPRRELAEI